MAKCSHGVEIAEGVVCRSCNPVLAGLRLVGVDAIRNDTHSGLQILPGELIKAEPFNDMRLQIESLKIVLADVAASAGLDIDVPAELAKAKKSLQVAEKLMED